MDFAEDMSFSQSASHNQETGNSAMDEQSEITKELLETAKNLEKNANIVSSAADGIGRYLLNEDGTIRDFTNYELMKGMHEMLKKGIVDMRQNTVAIQKIIDDNITNTVPLYHSCGTVLSYSEIPPVSV